MALNKKNSVCIAIPVTAGKRITLVFGKLNICFSRRKYILAEKTQFAGIANSLTGDTLYDIYERRIQKELERKMVKFSK